jgi:glycosyltransferase involved in cell wall biosynthesis
MALTPSEPTLSVVVCTYDRYALLPDAIHSLLRQQLDAGSLEIIVVDNSPNQENADRFRRGFANETTVTYLLEPTPGLSHARNVGVAHARADLVAFMDDDAVAAPDWAFHILRAFETFAGSAGVVGGRVLPRWVVCHERSRSTRLRATVREMEVGPPGSVIRSPIPSHRELLRSKAVVVSVAEKPGL